MVSLQEQSLKKSLARTLTQSEGMPTIKDFVAKNFGGFNAWPAGLSIEKKIIYTGVKRYLAEGPLNPAVTAFHSFLGDVITI